MIPLIPQNHLPSSSSAVVYVFVPIFIPVPFPVPFYDHVTSSSSVLLNDAVTGALAPPPSSFFEHDTIILNHHDDEVKQKDNQYVHDDLILAISASAASSVVCVLGASFLVRPKQRSFRRSRLDYESRESHAFMASSFLFGWHEMRSPCSPPNAKSCFKPRYYLTVFPPPSFEKCLPQPFATTTPSSYLTGSRSSHRCSSSSSSSSTPSSYYRNCGYQKRIINIIQDKQCTTPPTISSTTTRTIISSSTPSRPSDQQCFDLCSTRVRDLRVAYVIQQQHGLHGGAHVISGSGLGHLLQKGSGSGGRQLQLLQLQEQEHHHHHLLHGAGNARARASSKQCFEHISSLAQGPRHAAKERVQEREEEEERRPSFRRAGEGACSGGRVALAA
eukprot:TRINITY_DN2736_c0_g1_i2.p2 TRINITY_DN2736_c0_g1~~TRINITY_DN2736_c0_g1_i2.p2  ORF type:complete len:388 (-),score=84.04 TRINITY_DN2736_c0_g1_i2:309-1472(-)